MQPLCLNEIGRQLTCTRAQAKKTGRAPLFSAASDPLLRLAGSGYEGRQTSPGPAEAGRRPGIQCEGEIVCTYNTCGLAGRHRHQITPRNESLKGTGSPRAHVNPLPGTFNQTIQFKP